MNVNSHERYHPTPPPHPIVCGSRSRDEPIYTYIYIILYYIYILYYIQAYNDISWHEACCNTHFHEVSWSLTPLQFVAESCWLDVTSDWMYLDMLQCIHVLQHVPAWISSCTCQVCNDFELRCLAGTRSCGSLAWLRDLDSSPESMAWASWRMPPCLELRATMALDFLPSWARSLTPRWRNPSWMLNLQTDVWQWWPLSVCSFKMVLCSACCMFFACSFQVCARSFPLHVLCMFFACWMHVLCMFFPGSLRVLCAFFACFKCRVILLSLSFRHFQSISSAFGAST